MRDRLAEVNDSARFARSGLFVSPNVTHTALVTGARGPTPTLRYAATALLTSYPLLSPRRTRSCHLLCLQLLLLLFVYVCVALCPTTAITCCCSMFIMAENNPPPNASPSLRSWALPAANPMQSDRLYNVTQLISPPPEEILRRASVSC